MKTGYLHAGGAQLFYREVGDGHPTVVLHGGPDFDHTYLLPELDHLARSCRLVYYDQRGRGRSAAGVRPADVTLDSEIADLDAVRRSLELERIALLGHSWGCVLAMEYAIRHPERVSHLILLNTAPASHADSLRVREHFRTSRAPSDTAVLHSVAAGAAYRRGDLRAEAEYYRSHFRMAVRDPERLERLVGRLRAHFTPEAVLKARAIEDLLYEQTWRRGDYDLCPALNALDVPALVLHGEHDFVPVDVAARVADALRCARFDVLPECGHFAYLEAPDEVERRIAELLAR